MITRCRRDVTSSVLPDRVTQGALVPQPKWQSCRRLLEIEIHLVRQLRTFFIVSEMGSYLLFTYLLTCLLAYFVTSSLTQ